MMCKEAGIGEKKTKHSLRATGATALFNAGVPEKLIHDVTGHKSSALQLYERPTLQQRQMVSSIVVQCKQSFQAGKENVPDAATMPTPLPATTECSLPTTAEASQLAPANIIGSLLWFIAV